MNSIEQSKKWYREHKEEKKTKSKEYYQDHKDEASTRYRKYRNAVKLEVFNHYSQGKLECAICGEHDLDQLVLDHIDGNGKAHRKTYNYSVGTQTWIWAKRNNFPPIFQVLCGDCNLLKSFPERKVLLFARMKAKETSLRKRVESYILTMFGKRCDVFEPTCPCCKSWKYFDYLFSPDVYAEFETEVKAFDETVSGVEEK